MFMPAELLIWMLVYTSNSSVLDCTGPVPSAYWFVTFRVPAVNCVPPLQLLEPLRVTVPLVPMMVSTPGPVIAPLITVVPGPVICSDPLFEMLGAMAIDPTL